MIIMNEKIKATEVWVTGVDGEDLGIMNTKDALKLAKSLKVDLVCTSLFSSPPPCQLVRGSEHQAKQRQIKGQERKQATGGKLKEIRLTAQIEGHDYDTKKRQAERLLSSGHDVQLTVLVDRKQSEPARRLAEELARDLKHCSQQERGIQVSGKQAVVILRAVRE